MTEKRAREIFGNIKDTEIKNKYRELVMKHHPDKGGLASFFLEIREAYDFLIKDINVVQKRFDKYADQRKEDKLNKERTKRRKRALDPSDVELTIEVSVEELNEGFEQTVNYTRRKACDNCGGNGCYICDGSIKLEHLTVGVFIHSTLMNNKFEIIYKGLGDITYEAADLIINLKIVGSKFNLEIKPTESLPVVTSCVYVEDGQTEVKVKTLNGTKKISLPENHSNTINLKGQGLKFNTTKGIEYGNHYVYLQKINY